MALVKGEVFFGRQQGMNEVDIIMDDYKNPVAMISGLFNVKELKDLIARIEAIIEAIEQKKIK